VRGPLGRSRCGAPLTPTLSRPRESYAFAWGEREPTVYAVSLPAHESLS